MCVVTAVSCGRYLHLHLPSAASLFGFLKGFSSLICCRPPSVSVFSNAFPVLLRDASCVKLALQLVLEALPWGTPVTFFMTYLSIEHSFWRSYVLHTWQVSIPSELSGQEHGLDAGYELSPRVRCWPRCLAPWFHDVWKAPLVKAFWKLHLLLVQNPGFTYIHPGEWWQPQLCTLDSLLSSAGSDFSRHASASSKKAAGFGGVVVDVLGNCDVIGNDAPKVGPGEMLNCVEVWCQQKQKKLQ